VWFHWRRTGKNYYCGDAVVATTTAPSAVVVTTTTAPVAPIATDCFVVASQARNDKATFGFL